MTMGSMLVSARFGAFGAAALAAACAFTPPVWGQANDKMTPIAIPDQPNAIEIGTGPLPDAKAAESWHSQYGSRFARNVTVATITPFLPDPAKASGATGRSRRSVSVTSLASNPGTSRTCARPPSDS